MSEQYVSMSIASVGASTLPRQATRPFAVKETNATSDVDGAQPSKTKVWNKPDLWNNDDISGAKPMLLHRSRKSGENNSMRVDDIDGAQARIRDKMLLTKRHVDPMAPEYKLPYCKMEQAHVPKFVRDHITVSDIDKACPAPPKNYATRDPISVHDIVGAQACWRPRHE